MCGGKGTRFRGQNKSLTKYKNRTIISYVLEALRDINVKFIVLQTDQQHARKIKLEAEKYLNNFLVNPNPPKRFREGIKNNLKYLTNQFLFVVGNQPMDASFLRKLEYPCKNKNSWAVTLYPKESTTEDVIVSLSENKITCQKGDFVLLHPSILTKDIIGLQQKEGFKNKLEHTIKNQIGNREIYGLKAAMPPEFDDETMFKNTISYIKQKK